MKCDTTEILMLKICQNIRKIIKRLCFDSFAFDHQNLSSIKKIKSWFPHERFRHILNSYKNV